MAAKKRVASPGAGGAGKKRKLNAVAKVVRRSKHFSQPVQRILGKAAADSLGVYKDERHALQTTIVSMIGEVVSSAESGLKQSVAGAAGKLNEVNANHEALSAALQNAEADRTAKVDAESAARAAFAESESALSSLEKMKAKKAPWDEAPGKLESGKADAIPAATVRDLVRCGKDIELQRLILDTVAAGFKKATETRSTFEKYAISEFEAAVVAKVNELRGIDTSEDTIAAAATKKEGLKIALATAKAATTVAREVEAAARKPVLSLKSTIKRAQDALKVCDKKLQEFEKKPLTAYRDLMDLQAPAPPAPELVAEAEPAAAATE